MMRVLCTWSAIIRRLVLAPVVTGETVAAAGHAGDDIAADFPDRRAIIICEKRGFGFFPLGGTVFLHGAKDGDFATDIFIENFIGVEQVVFVVLFEYAQFFGISNGAEVNRRGHHGRGDVHETELEIAGGKRDVARVTDERDVRVINGDGKVGLIGHRGFMRGGLSGIGCHVLRGVHGAKVARHH